jgi:hypothetical protein
MVGLIQNSLALSDDASGVLEKFRVQSIGPPVKDFCRGQQVIKQFRIQRNFVQLELHKFGEKTSSILWLGGIYRIALDHATKGNALRQLVRSASLLASALPLGKLWVTHLPEHEGKQIR